MGQKSKQKESLGVFRRSFFFFLQLQYYFWYYNAVSRLLAEHGKSSVTAAAVGLGRSPDKSMACSLWSLLMGGVGGCCVCTTRRSCSAGTNEITQQQHFCSIRSSCFGIYSSSTLCCGRVGRYERSNLRPRQVRLLSRGPIVNRSKYG